MKSQAYLASILASVTALQQAAPETLAIVAVELRRIDGELAGLRDLVIEYKVQAQLELS